uniref:Uncharacterized protein n=1 Tax=Gopherus agassizii TaxID=38772 RepID=A0A452I6W2_9SAUR
ASSQQLCAAFSCCSRPGSQKPTTTQLLLLVAHQGLVTHPWSQARVGLGAAVACGGSCVRETCCKDFEAGVRREMEPDNAQTTNQTQTESLSPSPNNVSPVPLNNPTSAPRFGTVIPNRIFVGGIDFKVWFHHF